MPFSDENKALKYNFRHQDNHLHPKAYHTTHSPFIGGGGGEFLLYPIASVPCSSGFVQVVAHARTYTHDCFCIVFSKKFNLNSALFVYQSSTLVQKIDSREG